MKPQMIPLEAWNWLERDFLYADLKTVPETNWVEEDIDHMVLWLMEAGQVEIRHGNARLRIEAGEGILILPGRFKRCFSTDNRIGSFRLRWQWPTGKPLFHSAPPVRFRAFEEAALADCALGLAGFLERQGVPSPTARPSWPQFRVLPFELDAGAWFAWESKVKTLEQSLIRLLLDRGYQPELMRIHDDRILEALNRIRRHPITEPLRIEDLAADVGLSRGRLTRLFQEQAGSSPARILRQRRRRHIREKLERTRMPVKRIAHEAGFSSLSQFSDWCRRAYGLSPKALRNRANPL
jgi:AraC-like DNA-binding protein